LAVLAGLTALPLVVLLRYREPEESTARAATPRLASSFRALGSFFGQPGAARWTFAVVPLSYMGIASAYALLVPMLVDAGWPLGYVGAVSLVGGGIAALLASLAGGAALTVLGRRRALVASGLAQVVAVAALLSLADGGGVAAGLGAVALLNIAYALTGTAVYTINMDWSRAGSAGADYTVQDSFVHLCSQVAGAAGLALAGVVGYRPVVAVSLSLVLAGVAAAIWLFQERPPTGGLLEGAVEGGGDDVRWVGRRRRLPNGIPLSRGRFVR